MKTAVAAATMMRVRLEFQSEFNTILCTPSYEGSRVAAAASQPAILNRSYLRMKRASLPSRDAKGSRWEAFPFCDRINMYTTLSRTRT